MTLRAARSRRRRLLAGVPGCDISLSGLPAFSMSAPSSCSGCAHHARAQAIDKLAIGLTRPGRLT